MTWRSCPSDHDQRPTLDRVTVRQQVVLGSTVGFRPVAVEKEFETNSVYHSEVA